MPRPVDASGQVHFGTGPRFALALVADTDDPERHGRIRVRWVSLPDQPLSGWMRMTRPEAGHGRGHWSLPEPGDEVLVALVFPDPDDGIVIGALHNGVDPMPDDATDGGPPPGAAEAKGCRSSPAYADPRPHPSGADLRVWRSRRGHRVLLDDSEASPGLRLWDASGHLVLAFDTTTGRITLSSHGGDVVVRAGRDLVLEAGRDVAIRAGRDLTGHAQGDLRADAGRHLDLHGGDVDLRAARSLHLVGGTTASIRATLKIDVEAGLALAARAGLNTTVEAGGLVRVTGGTVIVS